MNRRKFIQSLAAVFSLPTINTVSFGTAQAAVPTAAAVPAQARSWAVYISTLHGECTPQTLQNLLNIPAADAKRYVGQLLAEGVLSPHPMLQKSVSKFVNKSEESFLDKVKERLELVEEEEVEETNSSEPFGETEELDAETQLPEDHGSNGELSGA